MATDDPVDTARTDPPDGTGRLGSRPAPGDAAPTTEKYPEPEDTMPTPEKRPEPEDTIPTPDKRPEAGDATPRPEIRAVSAETRTVPPTATMAAEEPRWRFSPVSLVFGIAFVVVAIAALANHGRIPAGNWLLPSAAIAVGVALLLSAGLRRP